MIDVTPSLTRLREALDVTELMLLSDSRLTLRSCSGVTDDDIGTACVGRLANIDEEVVRLCGANEAAAVELPLAAAPTRAADTLEIGANKPYSGVQVKYLTRHTVA